MADVTALSQKVLRDQAIKAISKHLQTHGSKGWVSLRAAFQQVPDRTWWRWVASVKKAQSERPLLASKDEASAPLALSDQKTSDRTEFIAQQVRRLNFTGMMTKHMRDIDLLQSYSLTEDGKIKNFAIFTQALILRERAMASFAKSVVPLTEPLMREDFMNGVWSAINATDKDTGRLVLQAIMDAGELGLTVLPKT